MPAQKKVAHPPPAKKLKLNSKKPKPVALTHFKTGTHDWDTIRQSVINQRGIVISHAFKHMPDGRMKIIKTKHLHNDSATNSKNSVFRKHNILSSRVDGKPLAFRAMMPTETGKVEFARNAMRIIKGRQATRGLTGEAAAIAKSVELASTIQISEFNRGGTMAVFNAMTNLYRMKRGPLAASQWHKQYKGGGKGGARKLRALSFEQATHPVAMRAIWKNHALTKDRWQGKSFEKWHAHKVTRWTGKASPDEFEKPVSSRPLLSLTRDQKWSAVVRNTLKGRGVVLSHNFLLQDGTAGELTTRHVHNDKDANVAISGQQHRVAEHNVLTSVGATRQNKAFGQLLTEGGDHVAHNTLRVLKNTQNRIDKGLFGTEAQAKAAIELGAAIGVSETARGGNHALLNAASSLYLLKHGALTAAQWNDPQVGYKGAGDHGAARLRAMTQPEHALDLPGLQAVHAKKGDGDFKTWLQHKMDRWTRRW